VAHLIYAEEISLAYMKKKAQGIDTAGDSGLRESVKMFVLKVSQRLPLKFKAPQVLAQSQPEQLSLDELTVRWHVVRSSLHEFTGSLMDSYLKRKIYKHPIAGKLNVVQAIAFMREHVNHHLPQIKRLL
jgi:hypothetical protein